MPTLNYYLGTLGRCCNTFRGRRLEGKELGPDDMSYLFLVCKEPGYSQDTLARRLCVHKSRVTRHVTRLEEAGYITRTPDPKDKRAMLVFPTDKAFEVLPLLREINGAWHDVLTSGFTPEETEQLKALLTRALANARRAVENEEEP